MTQADYERLRRQIERRYRADLAALERLRRRLAERPEPRMRRHHGVAAALVRRAIRNLDEQFDAYAVLRKISELQPEARVTVTTVSTALRRLASVTEDGQTPGETLLEIVNPGGARKPAVYRLARQFVTEDDLRF